MTGLPDLTYQTLPGYRPMKLDLYLRYRHVAMRRARADYEGYAFSCGRDDLAPCAQRRGAEHAV